ncbi:MAG: hypothetical protein M1825_005624 [Sarcosagium campestre]|nr:MAG: hypothetical protein M1825_005624 [Sarcosagium campestre]
MMITLHTFVLSPLLISISIPLTLLAILTSTIAFTTLLLRVLLVYIELGVVLIHTSLWPPEPRIYPEKISARRPSLPPSPSRRKPFKRRVSSSSSSAGTVMPPSPTQQMQQMQNPPMPRDFEGVGGWRLTAGPTDADDAQWTALNSRLVLPDRKKRRQHHRSLTSGSAGAMGSSSSSMASGGLGGGFSGVVFGGSGGGAGGGGMVTTGARELRRGGSDARLGKALRRAEAERASEAADRLAARKSSAASSMSSSSSSSTATVSDERDVHSLMMRFSSG